MPHRKLPHKWVQLWHIGVFSKDPQLLDNCSIAEVQKQYTEDGETDLINTFFCGESSRSLLEVNEWSLLDIVGRIRSWCLLVEGHGILDSSSFILEAALEVQWQTHLASPRLELT